MENLSFNVWLQDAAGNPYDLMYHLFDRKIQKTMINRQYDDLDEWAIQIVLFLLSEWVSILLPIRMDGGSFLFELKRKILWSGGHYQ